MTHLEKEVNIGHFSRNNINSVTNLKKGGA